MGRYLGIALMLALGTAPACGGGLTAGSGIEPDLQVVSLNDTERATVCDWTNSLSGGYGHDIVCSDGRTRPVDGTQQDCLQRLSSLGSTCPLPVREYEAWIRSIYANACAAEPGTPPECEVYFGCLGP